MGMTLVLKGTARLTRRSGDGNIIKQWEESNLIVTAGLGYVASRMKDATATAMSHMAVGASTTAPALTQTALQGTEHERVSGTVTVTDNTYRMEATFGSGIGSDVTVGEFGIFNASSGGTMLCRFITSSFTLPSAETLDVSWSITIGEE